MELSKAKLSVSLLICTLKSDFEGGRKVVLQTRIFFLFGDPEKRCKPTFFSVCRTTFLSPSKSLLRVQIKRLKDVSQQQTKQQQKSKQRNLVFYCIWFLVTGCWCIETNNYIRHNYFFCFTYDTKYGLVKKISFSTPLHCTRRLHII